MSKCFYCKGKAQYQLKNGRWCCSKSSNSCPAQRRKNSQSNKGKTRHTPEHLSQISKEKKKWNSGRTYEEVLGKEKANAIKKKLSVYFRENPITCTPEKDLERREKQSQAIKKRYAEGWMPKAGRCEKIRYASPIAGKVLLDGSWELEVAKFLDAQQIDWRRNKNRFAYFFDNKEVLYPGFLSRLLRNIHRSERV